MLRIKAKVIGQYLLALVVICLGGIASAMAVDAVRFDRAEAWIRHGDGRLTQIRAEVARTPEQRRRGLMYRTELAPQAGMLFDFGHERYLAMWMKNTRLSLDMLFISAAGEVVQIERRTQPGSLRSIAAQRPVRYVLELLAGSATRLGIRRGDRLGFRAVERIRPGWGYNGANAAKP